MDTAVMSGALWLLAAMLIDVLTPKELNVYMVGAVLAPAVIVGATFYHRKVPGPDLAISLATLWLVSVMVIEWITPKPLSPYFMTAAVAPSILVGAWFHGATKWRRRTGGASQGKSV
ncbi:MAG: hypothetical protein ABI561_03880 [Bradyrhizobium sp.]